MTKRFTRREILRMSGSMAIGSLLAACGLQSRSDLETSPIATAIPDPTPFTLPPTPVAVTVAWLGRPQDFDDEQKQRFEEENPGIEIEFLEERCFNGSLMCDFVSVPRWDILRIQAAAVPQCLMQGMLLDLTPYFEVSHVLSPDNLAFGNDYFKADSAFRVGSGAIYGMCQNWSPDFTLFAHKPAFEEMGLVAPDEATVLTYAEILELSRQLARFEAGQTVTRGYAYESEWIDRIWMNMLAELGQSLYTEDFSSIVLTANEDAKNVVRYYYNLNSEGLVDDPLNPSASWAGEDFVNQKAPLAQYGCWFGRYIEEAGSLAVDDIVMLPAPTWSDVRRNPPVAVTGYVIMANTETPDAAWRTFEWYMGGELALERARSGWGVPALKSLYTLMPNVTAFQQQMQRVLTGEIALNTPPLQFNPFLYSFALPVPLYDGTRFIASVWKENLQQALQGQITFDTLLQALESEINAEIRNGMDYLNGV